MGCLYQIEFPNGKSYIGITMKTAEQRFKGHTRLRDKTALAHALKKHGACNVKVKTLIIADRWDYLCDLEKKAIASYKTKIPHGYNLTDGGEGTLGVEWSEESRAKLSKARIGSIATPECRAKMSASRKGKPVSDACRLASLAAVVGKKKSPSHLAKMVAAATGKRPSDETKKKMSAAKLGNKNLLGHKHSEETKAKIGISSKGKIASAETRAKLSVAKMGNKNWVGKKHTEQTKAKMAASAAAGWVKRRLNAEANRGA